MTTLLLDASGRLSGAAVEAAGYAGVIRYLPLGTWKSVSKAEVDDMLAHGRTVNLVFETTANRAAQGRAAGVADAQRAIADQASLGFDPDEFPVYYAVDYDTGNPAEVDAYFQGVASVHGIDGDYGEAAVVHYLAGHKLVSFGWQAAAWSHGARAAEAVLFQRIGTAVVGGVQCDVNEVLADNYGQYPAPTQHTPDPAPEPGFTGEEDNTVIVYHRQKPDLYLLSTGGGLFIIRHPEPSIDELQKAGAKFVTVDDDTYSHMRSAAK